MQEHCVSTPVKSSITPDKVIMLTSVEFKSTPVNMDTSLTDTGDEEIATQTLSNNISDTDSATEIHPEQTEYDDNTNTRTNTNTNSDTDSASETDLEEINTGDVNEDTYMNTKTNGKVEYSIREYKKLSFPLTLSEEKLLTRLVKIKMEASADKETLECRTGGQRLVLRKITIPRKTSNDANTPLKKKRARAQKRIREQISGGSENAIKQHGTELKICKKYDTNKILKEAGHGKSVLTAIESVRIQTEFGHSNAQHRAQKQLFREKGILVSSQKEEDTVKNNALCNEIIIEPQSVTVNTEHGEEEYEIPVGKVKDLPGFVTDLLDKYDKKKALTWHDYTIPEGEIWIKLGGDHGKGSFKLTLQVLNVKKPNSPLNTFVVCLAECRDSRANLETILYPFKDQISRLSEMKWKDNEIQLFLCGDLEFLTKAFGLSGSAAVHPCLFCETTSTDMQKEPSNRVEPWIRNLRRLKSQNQRYVQAGSIKKMHDTTKMQFRSQYGTLS